jgi:hypothetical protein
MRGRRSTRPPGQARQSGQDAVSDAVLAAIAPFRCRSGIYLLHNRLPLVTATR